MASNSRFKTWLAKKLYFIVGVPLLFFALAPFPLGCGLIYPISDTLRGHPEWAHGTHPQKFVGLWVRDEPKMYDFQGQAFYLMPDGRLAGTPSMTVRSWHFDRDALFVDSVSRCGNCYQGNVTDEYTISFASPDLLAVINKDETDKWGLSGSYRRTQISDTLRSEMSRLQQSTNEPEAFRARMVLSTIEQFEFISGMRKLSTP